MHEGAFETGKWRLPTLLPNVTLWKVVALFRRAAKQQLYPA
jgi:hypothetical protein